MLAARTAPKARGNENLVLMVVYEDDIKEISKKMEEISKREDVAFFKRDALNIKKSPVLLLLGTKINPIELKRCGYCGFKNCKEKKEYKNTPCAFNSIDLGIATGAAVAIAADNRADNRVMFSVGYAVKELKFMGADVYNIVGIPLSGTSKSPFFDRT
ncbi:MAG: hypothetical protein BWY70_01496 [Bacteroidetes bacterium ADurb.Bin408]|nr:MAG: hypothetical protein BWY70_01496 [Bacteroidetes bacterium ADurb.Bin408]